MRRGRDNGKRFMLPFKVKGHEIIPSVDSTGVFSTELPDGEVVSHTTLAGLKTELAKVLEKAAKEARPGVPCCYIGYGDEPEQAWYVGKRKGAEQLWSSCFMFDVGASKKRENLSRGQVQEYIFKPTINLEKYKQLTTEISEAEKKLKEFLEVNRFDPTKGR